jgi:4-hydroxy-tetrahydrodipicolinate reductase
MMRIGIAGYGRMGRLIRELALASGHQVPVVIDPRSTADEVTGRVLTSKSLPLDVIIDFTEPAVVVDNIYCYAEMKVPSVIGTTGWYSSMDQVAAVVEKNETGLIWSGNFSLGVNLFCFLVREAGRIMNRFPQYDPMVHEYHHRHKVDSPSGTAQMIGEILVSTLERKKELVNNLPERSLNEHELNISSTRGGSIPGTHLVLFDSEADTISLKHSARNRSGFAEGALVAAEWIRDKKGLFDINDLMDSITGGVDDR